MVNGKKWNIHSFGKNISGGKWYLIFEGKLLRPGMLYFITYINNNYIHKYIIKYVSDY